MEALMQLLLPGITAPTRPAEARDARVALAAYPDTPTFELCRYAKVLGRAGEQLVDSMMTRFGERAYPADEHERHDRLLLLPDGTPLRMQIKTRHAQAENGDYVFNLHQRSERGCTGRGPYQPEDFDILAMVVLSENVVRFTADWHRRQVIRGCEIAELRRNPRASLDAALARLGHVAAIPGGWGPDLDLAI
jgi:hypothetical protein